MIKAIVTRFGLAIVVVCATAGVVGAQPGNIPRIDGVPMRAPHQSPAIYRIDLPSHDVHSGEVVQASVLTSSNVASVEARLKNFGMSLNHVGVGRFAFRYQVPWLPPFFKGNWPVKVIARNVDGVATQKTLYVHLR